MCPWNSEDDIRSPGTGVTGSCDVPSVGTASSNQPLSSLLLVVHCHLKFSLC